MQDIIKVIGDVGGLVVMAGLFVYQWTIENRNTQQALKQLTTAINEISEILRTIQEQNTENKIILKEHSEAIQRIENKIKEK